MSRIYFVIRISDFVIFFVGVIWGFKMGSCFFVGVFLV